MDIVGGLLVGGVSFSRNFIGILTRPYETYRRIVDRGTVWEIVYITTFLGIYFALSSLVKTASFRPFLLTKQFLILALGAGVGSAITVLTFWCMGFILRGEGKLGKLALAWAYTLLPTGFWFFVTSLLYVILPPPRTTSVAGVTFSILFLVFSATLFWWKITLVYLTLRFGMKLDLPKILAVVILSAPILGSWSYTMYALGIFKVPFL